MLGVSASNNHAADWRFEFFQQCASLIEGECAKFLARHYANLCLISANSPAW
jgi:hypothetical protein